MVGFFKIQLSNTKDIATIKMFHPRRLKLKLEEFRGTEILLNTGCKSKLNIGIVCRIMYV